MKFIETFESLALWMKIVLLLCVPVVGCNYRMLRYLESKNEGTLLWAVLGVIPGVNVFVAIMDIIGEVQGNKLNFHVD